VLVSVLGRTGTPCSKNDGRVETEYHTLLNFLGFSTLHRADQTKFVYRYFTDTKVGQNRRRFTLV